VHFVTQRMNVSNLVSLSEGCSVIRAKLGLKLCKASACRPLTRSVMLERPTMFKRALTSLSLFAAALMAAGAAHALTIKPFTAADLAAAQSAGAPVAVHFYADWCPTCKTQAKVFDALKADPDLDKLTLLVADFDKEVELKKAWSVRAQSVLVVFKGKTEVARNNGDTDAGKLKATLAASVSKK
jgi:thioredoxin 1